MSGHGFGCAKRILCYSWGKSIPCVNPEYPYEFHIKYSLTDHTYANYNSGTSDILLVRDPFNFIIKLQSGYCLRCDDTSNCSMLKQSTSVKQ